MIIQLNFEVEFASTGKKLQGCHEFKPGMTAITGPNESGKSMRLEMIRYALFGTKALRAPSSSYKTLNVSMWFTVNGKSYSVVRSTSHASLKQDGNMVANGTKATNAAMIDIFGYNLDVFDTANAICQKEAESLTRKAPADRKKMVDKVIGLETIDDLVNEVSEQITLTNAEINVAGKMLGEAPQPPEVPNGYQPSETLKSLLIVHDKRREREIQYKAQLDAARVDEPTPPGGEPLPAEYVQSLINQKVEYDTLQQWVKDSTQICNEVEKDWAKNNVRWLAYLETASMEYMQEYVSNGYGALFEKFHDWKARQAKIEEPKISLAELALVNKYIQNYMINIDLRQYENDGVECPHCHVSFNLDQSKIDALKAQLHNIDEGAAKELVTKHNISSLKDCVKHAQAWDQYEGILSIPEPPIPAGKFLGSDRYVLGVIEDLSKRDSDETTLAVRQANRDKAIESVKGKEDPTDRLRIATEDLGEWNKYRDLKERWDKYEALRAELEPSLGILADSAQERASCSYALNLSLQYERDLKSFDERVSARATAEQMVKETEAKLLQLTTVKKALAALKPRVKSYLMPSLNRVSSNLLSQMTNGARNRIEINDQFDILVDGQSVSEMSGSGEAIVNLAIRLALGTVLTNKVFSVLLADEIDASMDKERAAYTAECLRNLKQTISQIIIVSHQKPEADFQIEL